MQVCLSLCVLVDVRLRDEGGQKRALDSLEQASQVLVNRPAWVAGTWFRSSVGAASTLYC